MNRLSVIMTFTALLLAGSHLAAQEQVVAPDKQAKGKFAEIHGIRMYYEVYGEGEPLVLLHGCRPAHSGTEEHSGRRAGSIQSRRRFMCL